MLVPVVIRVAKGVSPGEFVDDFPRVEVLGHAREPVCPGVVLAGRWLGGSRGAGGVFFFSRFFGCAEEDCWGGIGGVRSVLLP